MHKKGKILLSSLIILPSISVINTNAIDNSNGPKGVVESNNFNFKYNTYLLEEIKDVPFKKVGNAEIIEMPMQISYKVNYPKIDYKESFMENIFYNYNELMEYRKELIYFVEISGNYGDELTFHDPGRYNIDISCYIDGEENKFGVYLMTFNAGIIYKRQMLIDFNIDNKTYHIKFEYFDYSMIYSKLNYFETIKEYNEFCDKYGVYYEK